MRKTAFIGHRLILANTLHSRLVEAIETEIHNGCLSFTMGTHGDFDKLALAACRMLRQTHLDINIEVAITSLNSLKNNNGNITHSTDYSDVKTIMYDIETAHYKQQIILSNRQMINTCDTLICYVDESINKSGAKTAMHYAARNGLKIINLFRKEDLPFYGIDQEKFTVEWNERYNKLQNDK